MPAETVGDEIRHLIKDKGYSPKRAQAAALNMERSGKLKKGKRGKKRGKKRGGGRY